MNPLSSVFKSTPNSSTSSKHSLELNISSTRNSLTKINGNSNSFLYIPLNSNSSLQINTLAINPVRDLPSSYNNITNDGKRLTKCQTKVMKKLHELYDTNLNVAKVHAFTTILTDETFRNIYDCLFSKKAINHVISPKLKLSDIISQQDIQNLSADISTQINNKLTKIIATSFNTIYTKATTADTKHREKIRDNLGFTTLTIAGYSQELENLKNTFASTTTISESLKTHSALNMCYENITIDIGYDIAGMHNKYLTQRYQYDARVRQKNNNKKDK